MEGLRNQAIQNRKNPTWFNNHLKHLEIIPEGYYRNNMLKNMYIIADNIQRIPKLKEFESILEKEATETVEKLQRYPHQTLTKDLDVLIVRPQFMELSRSIYKAKLNRPDTTTEEMTLPAANYDDELAQIKDQPENESSLLALYQSIPSDAVLKAVTRDFVREYELIGSLYEYLEVLLMRKEVEAYLRKKLNWVSYEVPQYLQGVTYPGSRTIFGSDFEDFPM